MDQNAQELLQGITDIEAGMAQYLQNNASGLTGRLQIYKPLDGKGDRVYFLRPDRMIDIESRDSIRDDYRITDELSIDRFASLYKSKGLTCAVKALSRKLEEQQPMLPFED